MARQAVHLHLRSAAETCIRQASKVSRWAHGVDDRADSCCVLMHKGQTSVSIVPGAAAAHLGAHVPDAAHAVAAPCHEDVQRRVQRQCIHPAQVAMVLPDDLRNSRAGLVWARRV